MAKPRGRCGVIVREYPVTQFDDFLQEEQVERTFALHWSYLNGKYDVTLFVLNEGRWAIVASKYKRTASTQLHLINQDMIQTLGRMIAKGKLLK